MPHAERQGMRVDRPLRRVVQSGSGTEWDKASTRLQMSSAGGTCKRGVENPAVLPVAGIERRLRGRLCPLNRLVSIRRCKF